MTQTKYRAVVVDLIPGVSDEQRADNASEAVADTIEQAEADALAGSAVNCPRRVMVQEDIAPFRLVKGPYVIGADSNGR